MHSKHHLLTKVFPVCYHPGDVIDAIVGMLFAGKQYNRAAADHCQQFCDQFGPAWMRHFDDTYPQALFVLISECAARLLSTDKLPCFRSDPNGTGILDWS